MRSTERPIPPTTADQRAAGLVGGHPEDSEGARLVLGARAQNRRRGAHGDCALPGGAPSVINGTIPGCVCADIGSRHDEDEPMYAERTSSGEPPNPFGGRTQHMKLLHARDETSRGRDADASTAEKRGYGAKGCRGEPWMPLRRMRRPREQDRAPCAPRTLQSRMLLELGPSSLFWARLWTAPKCIAYDKDE